jgi:hypothetical protein
VLFHRVAIADKHEFLDTTRIAGRVVGQGNERMAGGHRRDIAANPDASTSRATVSATIAARPFVIVRRRHRELPSTASPVSAIAITATSRGRVKLCVTPSSAHGTDGSTGKGTNVEVREDS